MKKTVFLLVLFGVAFLALFNSCNKTSRTKKSDPIIIMPPGSGSIPVVTTPPCTPTVNSVKIKSGQTLSFYAVSSDNIHDYWEIEGNSENGDCTIEFTDNEAPIEGGIYKIVSEKKGHSDEVAINMVTGGVFSYYYVANSGSLYVNIVDGMVEATFCDIKFSSPSVSTTYTASGKMKVN